MLVREPAPIVCVFEVLLRMSHNLPSKRLCILVRASFLDVWEGNLDCLLWDQALILQSLIFGVLSFWVLFECFFTRLRFFVQILERLVNLCLLIADIFVPFVDWVKEVVVGLCILAITIDFASELGLQCSGGPVALIVCRKLFRVHLFNCGIARSKDLLWPGNIILGYEGFAVSRHESWFSQTSWLFYVVEYLGEDYVALYIFGLCKLFDSLAVVVQISDALHNLIIAIMYLTTYLFSQLISFLLIGR